MTTKVIGSRLYGAMVIAMAQAVKLGRVHEIYIDPAARRISGISYKSSVLGTEEEAYVDFGAILKFSNDMVIIDDQTSGGERPAEIAPFALRALKRNQITTQSGTHIATLADMVFDQTDGKIAEIHLPENLRLDIDMEQVILGPDLIMVPADYELATSRTESETRDFFDRIFGNTQFSEKLREGYEGAKNSVRSNVTREKVVDSLKTGSARARDSALRTSQAIQQAIEQITNRRQAEKKSEETSDAGKGDTQAAGSGADIENAQSGDEAPTQDSQTSEKV